MGDITYNIYCDESCHLENDKGPMALGAIWCDKDKLSKISSYIRSIKKKHNMPAAFEIKWTKVSASKFTFYADLINYFFDETELHFRAIIIPEKNKLNHSAYNQTHDEWYYKMYFLLIKQILEPSNQFNIYIDIKDTRGSEKVQKLREILSNNAYDFDKRIVKKTQQVRSHETIIMQLTDLLIGSLTYLHRKRASSYAKLQLIELIKKRSGHVLMNSTLPKENKFNLFVWSPREW
jgi:hypothetical protein